MKKPNQEQPNWVTEYNYYDASIKRGKKKKLPVFIRKDPYDLSTWKLSTKAK